MTNQTQEAARGPFRQQKPSSSTITRLVVSIPDDVIEEDSFGESWHSFEAETASPGKSGKRDPRRRAQVRLHSRPRNQRDSVCITGHTCRGSLLSHAQSTEREREGRTDRALLCAVGKQRSLTPAGPHGPFGTSGQEIHLLPLAAPPAGLLPLALSPPPFLLRFFLLSDLRSARPSGSSTSPRYSSST